MMDLTSLLPFAGALFGGASSGDAKRTQTANRDPWGPTQGWLTSNLGLGQSLQSSYMANPLSAAQQAAYNNSFATTGLGRSIAGRVIPQLSSTQFFDRTNPLNRPTPLSFVGGDASGTGANGSLGLGGGLGGYMPTASYAPTVASSGNGAAPVLIPHEGGRGDYGSGGGYVSESPLAGPSPTGTVLGDLTLAGMNGYLGLPGRLAAGAFLNPVTVSVAKAARDSLAAEIAKDPTFGGGGYTGPGGTTTATGAGIAANPMGKDPATAQGQNASNYGGPAASSDGGWSAADAGATGNDGGGVSGIGDGGVAGASMGGPNGGGDGPTGGNGYAKGGMVKKSKLRGPDPKGPDEGQASLQSGEYVIKKAAVKKYGKGLLSDINNMKA